MKLLLILTVIFLTFSSVVYGQGTSSKTVEKPAYDVRLLTSEPDPSLFKSGFKPSAQVRGLKGTDGIIYWLSPDLQSITAYQNTKVLWTTNLAAALPPETTGPLTTRSMAWCSNALFFSVGKSGFVELNRQTGQVNQAGTD